MVKWFFIFLLGGILTIGLSLYYKLGAYKDVKIAKGSVPMMNLLYQDHFGSYHKIGGAIQRVENWALENNFSCERSFGIYLDDPSKIDEDRLRSQGGCITDAIVPSNDLPLDFKQRQLNKGEFIVAQFTGSPAIGPFVVYPKVEKWAIDNRMKIKPPTIEIYKLNKSTIETTYLFNFE